MNGNFLDQIDFGPLKEYLEADDITDISYANHGQIHLKTLSKGIFRIENKDINDAFMEKLAFQCSNAMGKSFNMAHPFLDAESAELRLNFVHDSIATNGIACVIRKTPAKIRLEKDKILADKYIELDIHDFLIKCVEGHCNIIVSGETGSGKTEFVKYLAAHTKETEKLITIEDTLELHLDRIFPHRDIVAMKTNNIASYTDVLVTCMRQNPKWILLSEVRSAEAVTAARNSISSGHYILSTIHADKASSIPNRMYSLMETTQDIDQFLKSIYRYIQIGVYVRGYQDKKTHSFRREIAEVVEFYVTEDNDACVNTIYKKTMEGRVIRNEPSKYLVDYLEGQGVVLPKDLIKPGEIILEDADLLNHDAPQETEEIRKVRAEFEGEVKPSSAISNQSPNMNSVPATGTVTNVGQAPSMNQPIPNSIPNTQTPGNQPGSRPVMPNTTPTSNGNTGTTIEAPKVNFRINPNKFE